MSTNNGIRLRVHISNLSYATGTLTLRFKYGGTTVISDVLTPTTSSLGVLEYELYANNSASSQIAFNRIFLSPQSTTASQTTSQVTSHASGAASEASAGALNVTVTAEWSSNNVGNSITMHSAVIETIQG